MPTYTMVSRLNTSACTKPEKMSKYRESTAGMPTCRKGIYPRRPGSHPKIRDEAAASAEYKRLVSTPPPMILPK